VQSTRLMWFGRLPGAAPLLAGFALMYAPVYCDLARDFWLHGRCVQGPVVLALLVWLFMRECPALASGRGVSRGHVTTRLGMIAVFSAGLLCYALGRTQQLLQLELTSQVLVALGVVWTVLGSSAVRRLGPVLVLSLFLIPVPGTLLDGVLMPLKQSVSALADAALHAAGYPVGRTGVMLTIGRYDLLIADACSGLNSMVALSGIGLLYAQLVRDAPRWRTALLLGSILPVAFAANVLRVIVLLLVTYCAGDAAGRSFHFLAEYLEIAFALAALFAIDRGATRVARMGGTAHAPRTPAPVRA